MCRIRFTTTIGRTLYLHTQSRPLAAQSGRERAELSGCEWADLFGRRWADLSGRMWTDLSSRGGKHDITYLSTIQFSQCEETFAERGDNCVWSKPLLIQLPTTPLLPIMSISRHAK